ncbi:hypothetical protein [Stakelama marina]|uniref:Uncharacterized protein n=1 Tax=Stakelama marina TaxID=2826939 RepID=A0A8T4IBF6_9SPHN|nr:hypothetical protein [Stakelama marina]MBR0551154.1 hypothetical protein [Stakelama marina]
MADKDQETHVNTDRARAGTTPHMTRYILAISMVLIVIIYAIIVWTG